MNIGSRKTNEMITDPNYIYDIISLKSVQDDEDCSRFNEK